MKIFYDTEFIEDGRTIDLISIGMIADDGHWRELVGDAAVARAARMCPHGNVPWPCPTIATLDATTDPKETTL